jgi:hypothetical protein
VLVIVKQGSEDEAITGGLRLAEVVVGVSLLVTDTTLGAAAWTTKTITIECQSNIRGVNGGKPPSGNIRTKILDADNYNRLSKMQGYSCNATPLRVLNHRFGFCCAPD